MQYSNSLSSTQKESCPQPTVCSLIFSEKYLLLVLGINPVLNNLHPTLTDDDFSRGKEDTFFVTDRNLGRLQKLRISHNGDEGWHLARARVTNLDTDARATFVCNNWIENGDPEQRTERELVAADERDLARARETYLVRIYTSDRANAGTDATVSFVVYGEGGESAEQRLPGGRLITLSKRREFVLLF